MLEIVLWSGIIFGGSIVYAMLGGQPAPRENKRDNKKETKNNYKETYNYFFLVITYLLIKGKVIIC